MIPSISSFETNIFFSDPKTFLCIPASAVAVSPNGINTRFENVGTIFIKGKSAFCNGLINLPRNPCDYTISASQVFDNYILADKVFVKALWSLEISY